MIKTSNSQLPDTALALPAELSIYTAAELRGRWLAWAADAAEAGPVALADGGGVTQVDGAGLQLLVALQHTLAARGCALRLRHPSPALCEGCTRLGLSTWLDELQAGPATPEAP